MRKDKLKMILDSFAKHVQSMDEKTFKAKLDELEDDPLTFLIEEALNNGRKMHIVAKKKRRCL